VRRLARVADLGDAGAHKPVELGEACAGRAVSDRALVDAEQAGLDMKLEQYRMGEAFINRVVELRGHDLARIGERLGLGRQVTLPEAQATVPYGISYPQALGTPDAVFLIEPPGQHAVTLVWWPRSGLPEAGHTGVGALVIEVPGKVQSDFFLKMLGPDAALEAVQVNSNPGYWISGKPHGFFFLDPNGTPQEDTFRLAGNTLIWNQGSLTVRIESALDKDQTLGLAATMQ